MFRRTLIATLAFALFAFGTLVVDNNVAPVQNSVEIADGWPPGPPPMAPPPISDSEAAA